MKIFIQNMVSRRCKMMVSQELEKLGVAYRSIDLGEVLLYEPLPDEGRNLLKAALKVSGLQVMDDKRALLIEQVIQLVSDLLNNGSELPKVSIPKYLSEQTQLEYNKLADIFSKAKGVTIEHYFILQKVERIKELILYDEQSLNEISYIMNYSSAAHLSKQFKQVTGLTPSFFKELAKKRKNKLELM